MQDLYSILGVPRDAGSLEIKAAYRTLAKKAHPDHNLGDDAAEDRTKEINLAYRILGDPELRETYDQELARKSVRRRRVFFVNATAVAAGIAAFAITAGGLTAAIPWLHSSPPQQLSELAPLKASGSQIETSAREVPVSGGGNSAAPAPQGKRGEAIHAEGVKEIANAGSTAPATPNGSGTGNPSQEAPARIVTAGPGAPDAASNVDGKAEVPVRVAAAAPLAPESLAESASHESSGAVIPGPITPVPAVGADPKDASVRETPAEQAALFKDLRPEAGARQVTAPSDPSGQPNAGTGEYAVRHERNAIRKVSKKSDEWTRPSGSETFVIPRLRQQAEPLPWPTSRKTMLLHWQSTGGETFVPGTTR